MRLQFPRTDFLAHPGINVPSTLNVSLLSANLIENPFRNVRRKIDRVTRWREETDQPSCWLAYALGEARKGFRRLRHSEDLVKLYRLRVEAVILLH